MLVHVPVHLNFHAQFQKLAKAGRNASDPVPKQCLNGPKECFVVPILVEKANCTVRGDGHWGFVCDYKYNCSAELTFNALRYCCGMCSWKGHIRETPFGSRGKRY